MKVEMRDDRHLWIQLGHPSTDPRGVIIDAGLPIKSIDPPNRVIDFGDVRIVDHRGVVKVRFDRKGNIKDVLVDDIFVYQREK